MSDTNIDIAVALSPRESWLLRVLDARRNRVVPRQTLLDIVWGPGYPGDPSTLAVHMSRLRSKLASAGIGSRIRTVRGVGYILEDQQSA